MSLQSALVVLSLLLHSIPSISVTSRKDMWLEQAKLGAKLPDPLTFKFSRAPHLRVAAESWPPHIEVHPETATTRLTGPMANFLNALADSLNFTYSVVQGDGYWGAPQGNGSWNGMIGMVLRKEADFGLGPFGMSYIRNQVVDFTMPLFREVLHVLVARPTPEPDPWGFIAPFTWPVWIGSLASLFLVTVASMVVSKTLSMGTSTSSPNHFWTAFLIFASQSLPKVAEGISVRVIMLLWMFVMFILTRSYSGAMTSLLAVKRVPIKYDSLQDVLDDPKIKILMEGSTALTAHLESVQTGSGIYRVLGDAVRVRGTFVKASAMQDFAYEYIPSGRYAMFLEAVGCNKVYSDHFQKTGRCDFYKSKEVFWPLLYALIVPIGSPLRNLIDARILGLREFGIYDRWALDQTPNMISCIKMPTTIKMTEPYTIFDLWAMFLATMCGILIAAVIFGGELLTNWFFEDREGSA